MALIGSQRNSSFLEMVYVEGHGVPVLLTDKHQRNHEFYTHRLFSSTEGMCIPVFHPEVWECVA